MEGSGICSMDFDKDLNWLAVSDDKGKLLLCCINPEKAPQSSIFSLFFSRHSQKKKLNFK